MYTVYIVHDSSTTLWKVSDSNNAAHTTYQEKPYTKYPG